MEIIGMLVAAIITILLIIGVLEVIGGVLSKSANARALPVIDHVQEMCRDQVIEEINVAERLAAGRRMVGVINYSNRTADGYFSDHVDEKLTKDLQDSLYAHGRCLLVDGEQLVQEIMLLDDPDEYPTLSTRYLTCAIAAKMAKAILTAQGAVGELSAPVRQAALDAIEQQWSKCLDAAKKGIEIRSI